MLVGKFYQLFSAEQVCEVHMLNTQGAAQLHCGCLLWAWQKALERNMLKENLNHFPQKQTVSYTKTQLVFYKSEYLMSALTVRLKFDL